MYVYKNVPYLGIDDMANTFNALEAFECFEKNTPGWALATTTRSDHHQAVMNQRYLIQLQHLTEQTSHNTTVLTAQSAEPISQDVYHLISSEYKKQHTWTVDLRTTFILSKEGCMEASKANSMYKRNYSFRMNIMGEIFKVRSCIDILANDIKKIYTIDYLSVELGFIVCFLHFMHICHARHYSTVRNVHYRKRKKTKYMLYS